MRRLLTMRRAGFLLLPWLVCLPFLTAQRVTVFFSDHTLWADAVRQAPTMPRARVNLADALWNEHQPEQAVMHLHVVLEQAPTAPLVETRRSKYLFLANVELGSIAGQLGDPLAQARYYMAATRTNPKLVFYLTERTR